MSTQKTKVTRSFQKKTITPPTLRAWKHFTATVIDNLSTEVVSAGILKYWESDLSALQVALRNAVIPAMWNWQSSVMLNMMVCVPPSRELYKVFACSVCNLPTVVKTAASGIWYHFDTTGDIYAEGYHFAVVDNEDSFAYFHNQRLPVIRVITDVEDRVHVTTTYSSDRDWIVDSASPHFLDDLRIAMKQIMCQKSFE
jgi:hypothetical protein